MTATMRGEWRDTTWTRLMDRGGSAVGGAALVACTFDNCALSLTADVEAMSRIAEVRLERCRSSNSVIGPCILDEVEVDGLAISGLLIVWGAWFRHVTLRGRVGNVKINRSIHDPHRTPETQATFDRARERFYAECDWAIDISAAELSQFHVDGVPTDLIRRDPVTQVVVERARLRPTLLPDLRGDFPDLEFELRMFLERSNDSSLLVVAPRARGRRAFDLAMAGVAALRDAGVTQPD